MAKILCKNLSKISRKVVLKKSTCLDLANLVLRDQKDWKKTILFSFNLRSKQTLFISTQHMKHELNNIGCTPHIDFKKYYVT